MIWTNLSEIILSCLSNSFIVRGRALSVPVPDLIKIGQARPSTKCAIEQKMWKSDGAKLGLKTACGINFTKSSSPIVCRILLVVSDDKLFCYKTIVFTSSSSMHRGQISWVEIDGFFRTSPKWIMHSKFHQTQNIAFPKKPIPQGPANYFLYRD